MVTFISIYFLVFGIGTGLMDLTGVDAKTASSSVATCIAGIGLRIGTIGPAFNFPHLPELAK
jgi:trk system potassium uptake protein TrkH